MTPDTTEFSARARAITEREIARYAEMTQGSQRQTAKARKVLPLGVASNFQFFDPHPVVIQRAQGSSMWDVDGNVFIDYNMGYGSLLAGHSHPLMVEAIKRQVSEGTLFVTPAPLNEEVAAELCRRFPPMDMVRFTNSGTEATMDALRLARAFTKREKIVKVEGCYHGHHDLAMISVKPPLDEAGPADNPRRCPTSAASPRPPSTRSSSSRTTTSRRWSGRSPRMARDRRLHPRAGAREHGHRPARRRVTWRRPSTSCTSTARW